MNDVQVGSVIRAVRIRRGLRQSDVARAAGVSPAAVSRIERGDFGRTSVHALRAVGEAVAVSLPMAPRWRGADLAKLLDERHAGMVCEVVARLTSLGWVAVPEHTFSVQGERGSIDVIAWLPARRALLIVEVKTVLVDLQDLLSTFNRKRRLAPRLARDLGWHPLRIGAVIVMPAETQARTAVARYAALLAPSYPSRGADIRRWLRFPDLDLNGIWFLPNSHPVTAKRRPGGSARVRPRRGRPDNPIPRSSPSDGAPAGQVASPSGAYSATWRSRCEK
jgi:transcriptional regulator with XRE-family HTH domain